MTGRYTLDQTEQAINARLAGLDVDRDAMAAVGNIYRAAGVVRNHLERTVLARHDLTWTSWVVLWVVWVWEEIETRHAASEAGISKSTLTGVVGTLTRRGLMRRTAHPGDGRRALLTLTPDAQRLMTRLFPEFNRQERAAVAALTSAQARSLAASLGAVVRDLEGRQATTGMSTVRPTG